MTNTYGSMDVYVDFYAKTTSIFK